MTSYEAIFRRRSIRKYKNDEISPAMLEKIEKFGEDAIGIRPDIQVKWKIFRKEEHQLKGLFRVDAPYDVVLYSEICEDYRKNRSFETWISLRRRRRRQCLPTGSAPGLCPT